jgi:hypothetical protein
MRRIEAEPIRQRTEWAFLKSRASTKMFRRSDFRNARPVRKVLNRKPAKAAVGFARYSTKCLRNSIWTAI